EVRQRGGQAEHGHDLTGDDDVEGVLARHSPIDAAEADDDSPQGTIVEVDDAADVDATGIDVELVAEVDVVVEHGRGEVVRGRDRGEVTGDVEVDVLNRHDLGVAAAGCAALHPDDRPHGRLAQRQHRSTDLGSAARELVEPVGQADARRGLALSCRSGAHGGDED